jgi:invasion protein IalB
MTSCVRTLALAAALCAFASGLMAQEAATETPTESPVETPAEPADGVTTAGDTLSMGSTIEPAPGQTYVREEFGDWDLRCVRTEDGTDPCQLYQLLLDEEGNSVAEVSMFAIDDEGPASAGATIITPLETLLTEQIRIAVDASPVKQYPFSFCSQVGCFSRVGFTAEEVDAFRRGSVATITIVPAAAPTQRVNLNMSLIGFTAGFEAVRAANAE